MIVIDVGCAKHGGDESIPYLIEEFRPDVLYGFDPVGVADGDDLIEDTRVVLRRAAAWTHEGIVTFVADGIRGHVEPWGTGELVACFDLAHFILDLPDEPVVLKLDCEGAEYELLPHLVATGADLRLQLAWVEFHCPSCGTGWFSADDRCGRCEHHEPGKRSDVEAAMRCEMHQWNR